MEFPSKKAQSQQDFLALKVGTGVIGAAEMTEA